MVSSQTYSYQVCMLRQGRIFLWDLNKKEHWGNKETGDQGLVWQPEEVAKDHGRYCRKKWIYFSLLKLSHTSSLVLVWASSVPEPLQRTLFISVVSWNSSLVTSHIRHAFRSSRTIKNLSYFTECFWRSILDNCGIHNYVERTITLNASDYGLLFSGGAASAAVTCLNA